jgi:hypothetical protein
MAKKQNKEFSERLKKVLHTVNIGIQQLHLSEIIYHERFPDRLREEYELIKKRY